MILEYYTVTWCSHHLCWSTDYNLPIPIILGNLGNVFFFYNNWIVLDWTSYAVLYFPSIFATFYLMTHWMVSFFLSIPPLYFWQQHALCPEKAWWYQLRSQKEYFCQLRLHYPYYVPSEIHHLSCGVSIKFPHMVCLSTGSMENTFLSHYNFNPGV